MISLMESWVRIPHLPAQRQGLPCFRQIMFQTKILYCLRQSNAAWARQLGLSMVTPQLKLHISVKDSKSLVNGLSSLRLSCIDTFRRTRKPARVARMARRAIRDTHPLLAESL